MSPPSLLLSGQVFTDSGPIWIVQDDLIWGSLMTSAKHFPDQVIRGFLVDISFSETAIDPTAASYYSVTVFSDNKEVT